LPQIEIAGHMGKQVKQECLITELQEALEHVKMLRDCCSFAHIAGKYGITTAGGRMWPYTWKIIQKQNSTTASALNVSQNIIMIFYVMRREVFFLKSGRQTSTAAGRD